MTIEFGGGTPIMCRNVYFAAIEQVDRLENRLKGALGLFRIKVTNINLRQASGTSYEEKLELIRQANVFQEDEQRRDKRAVTQPPQEVKQYQDEEKEKEKRAAAQSLPLDDPINDEQEREERAVAQFLQFGKILLEGGSPLVGILREGLSLFKTMQTDTVDRSAAGALVAEGVGVDGQEHVGLALARQVPAPTQTDVIVTAANQRRRKSGLALEESLQLFRDRQHHFLFPQFARPEGAGVFAAVSRINGDDDIAALAALR